MAHVQEDYVALREFVGAPHSDNDYVDDCWHEAEALVINMCGDAIANVPAVILQRAKLNCGSELYHQRSAPQGISQFASADGSVVRVARDPMVAAVKILQPFLPIGAA